MLNCFTGMSLEWSTLRVLMCIKALVGHVMHLKKLLIVSFERSEPFHLLRMMCVSVPSLHIESTSSMTHIVYMHIHICLINGLVVCHQAVPF